MTEEDRLNQLYEDLEELIRRGYLEVDEDGHFNLTAAGHQQANPETAA